MLLSSFVQPLLATAIAVGLSAGPLAGHAVAEPTVLGMASGTASSALAAAQELPLRFLGDGMTLIVTELDEAQGKVAGTLQLPGGSPLPFKLDLTVKANGLQVGRGRVQDGTASLRLKTSENEDGSIKVTYRAKRYVISLSVGGDAPPPVPPPGPENTAGTIRLKVHTFNDPKFRGQPSHQMLVPTGWKVEGGAFWAPPNLYKVMPDAEIKLTSPEGVSLQVEAAFMAVDKTPPSHLGMQRMPEGSIDDGVPVMHVPLDLASWKTKFEKTLLPGSNPKARNIRVLDVAIVPELTEPFRRQMEPMRQMNAQHAAMEAQMGGQTNFECFVLGVESRYTLGGVEYEELSLSAMSVLTIDNPMMGREVRWTLERGLTMRAPVGKLAGSIGLLSTLSNSLTATGPWLQNRAQILAKVIGSSIDAAAHRQRETTKRTAIMSKAFDDVRRSSHESYQRSSAASDRLHDSVLRSIDESEIYTDQGRSVGVQLPGGFDHVYSNGNNEYILTNDAFVNPATDLGPGNWNALKKAGR